MSDEPEYIDLITGKPLEPWAADAMRARAKKPVAVEAIGGGEAEKVENRPRLLAMDHVNSIEEPIRGVDERGHPYLSYSGAHVIAAFVAGMQKQAALATPQPVSGDAVREALDWFSGQHRLSLEHCSPMYCDDDDQSVEWRVLFQSGSINDREWELVGSGETALCAILDARHTLERAEAHS